MKYYTPLKFVFISATLNTLILISSGIYDETLTPQMEQQLVGKDEAIAAKLRDFQSFTRDYISLLSLLQLPFIALTSMFLLRKPQFNYAEHLIYNAYAMAQVNIYQIAGFIILWMLPDLFRDYQSITIISVGLYFVVYYQFTLGLFHYKWYSVLWRALLAYMLSVVIYTVLIGMASALYAFL